MNASSRGPRAVLGMLAALVVALPAGAQAPQVPAVLNTYRLPPGGAAAIATGTVNLSQREVRELYFESFVAGAMQGEPGGGGAYGVDSAGRAYPVLARDLSPTERMPRMPLTRNPGPDGYFGVGPGPDARFGTPDDVCDDELLLTLRIDKLPTRATSQRVVDHLAALGLLPAGGVNTPQATGRWRVIIHPPRVKGAPPAPSLYYPEALSGLRPSTPTADVTGTPVDPPNWGTTAIRAFWGDLAARWRQWDRWVSAVYTNTPNPNVHVEAHPNWGMEAEPFFVPFPAYLANRPINRRSNAARTSFQPIQAPHDEEHARFFNERGVWENRLLDPDQPGKNPADPNPINRLPEAVMISESNHAEPLQYIINVDSSSAPAPLNAAPAGGPKPDGWTLPGVHTSGPAESNGAGVPAPFDAEQYTVVHDQDHAGDSRTGPGNAYYLLAPAIELTVNLLDGRWWDGAAWRGRAKPQRMVPGVGLVELQFEYETSVPGANESLRRDWSQRWFGPPGNDIYNDGNDQWQVAGLPNPRGADGIGGTLDDRAPFNVSYFYAPIDDPRVGTTRILRDPLVDPTLPEPAATNPPWRIRRFSGWPFHPAFATLQAGDTSYQGGPLVCRFLVSAVSVVPEDQAITTQYHQNPDLELLGRYDPSSGVYYPQLDAFPSRALSAPSDPNDLPDAMDVYDVLERPVFLLGYRADDGGPGGSRSEDYFFPIRHGGRSAKHRLFVRSVTDHLAGGSAHLWTPGAATLSAIWQFGYPLRGTLDPRGPRLVSPAAPTSVNVEDLIAFEYSSAAVPDPLPPVGYPLRKLFLRRALRTSDNGDVYAYLATGIHNRTNVARTDVGRYAVNAAFDGERRRPASALNDVVVPPNYSLGLHLDPPTNVDRIEVYWENTGPATPWEVQVFSPGGSAFGGAFPQKWDTRPRVALSSAVTLSGTTNFAWAPGPVAQDIHGIRIRNTSGANLRVDEIRVVTRGDLRRAVLRPPVAPRQGPDPDIAPQPIAGSAVEFAAPVSREFSVEGDSVATADVQVAVPRFQPPSCDAVERQILTDRGQPPSGYATRSQPTAHDPSAPRDWDRYRGEVAIYVDETRSRSWAAGVNKNFYTSVPVARANYTKSQFDTDLYRLRSRAAGELTGPGGYSSPAMQPTTQFVAWYEEDSGWVSPASGAPGYAPQYQLSTTAARLEELLPVRQHVAVEPYATFDLEFTVGFERRLSIAESLLDFGKVVHGGISQWVPATVVNEGNVPLRSVRLYVERPLTPVDLEDGSTVARLSQQNPVPAWFFENLAVGAAGEEGSLGFVDASGAAALQQLDPAPVGSPNGRALGDLYLRVGRLAIGRQVPVGQPMGNYTGLLRAFVDNLGDPTGDVTGDGNDRPDSVAEVNLGGSATMKLTVTESPWARIRGWWDNEIDRNEDQLGAPTVATLPYDPVSGSGTYQPVPVFDPWYTQPDLNEATPTVAVVQDPDAMDDDPPNPLDRLWLASSRYEPQGGGANWRVYFRDAGRPVVPSGVTLQTGYRSFLWPAAAAAGLSAPSATQRNLYPSVCRVPEILGGNQQHLLLWHNEREENGKRRSYLQFVRYEGTNSSGVMEFADDASGAGLVNKQVPRAFVDNVAGTPILWCTWQSGEGGGTQFGFNAVAMPGAYGAPGTSYTDAIGSGGSQFVNYRLRTPPGLGNLLEPWVVPSYRHAQTNAATGEDLQAVNVFYSAWSPVHENQDLYWSRYLPMEDPLSLASVRESPMAEDAFRLRTVPSHPWGPNEGFTVATQPGGRLPFPRELNELLRPNANATQLTAAGLDWLMPPEQPRVSYLQGGVRRLDAWNHRGFADTDRPLFDNSRAAVLPTAGAPDPALDPLVVLRVYQAPTLTGGPSTDPVNEALLVGFDLPRSYWDPAAGEWMLALNPNAPGSALLLNRAISYVRIHPGLGRVTFDKPLYRRGVQLPLYLYATYRPCAWRLTSDRSADSQPTAAFDPWSRLTIAWRRTDEGGQSQLWYRTFSLAVPLLRAPAMRLQAVCDDTDADDDRRFNGSQGELSHWYFVARLGGENNDADGAWSSLSLTPTAQGFDLLPHDNSVNDSPTPGTQSIAAAGWNGASMLHFGYDDAGKRVRVWYEYEYTDANGALATGQAEEAFYVPGLGPERRVPLDGQGAESQPALAVESFYTGYPLGGQAQPEPILASRLWLAWVSTRDLYVEGANGAQPPRPGNGAGHVYFGTFLPDYSPATTRPW